MLRQILKLVGLVMLLSAATESAWANNNLLNVQGKLTNSSGTPLSGIYTVTFRLYTTLTGGTSIWSESDSVVASTGLFNVTLGIATSMDSIQFQQPYYLGIQVAGDSNELSPRQLLGASAYALGSLGNFNASSATITSLSVSTITAVSSATITNLSITGTLTSSAILGKLVQTVFAYVSGTNSFSTSSTSFQKSNLAVTITPKSSSDYILVMAVFCGGSDTSGGAGFYDLYRNNSLLSGDSEGFYRISAISGGGFTAGPVMYSDSPATTSATTYTIGTKSNGTGSAYVGVSSQEAMTIIAMEYIP